MSLEIYIQCFNRPKTRKNIARIFSFCFLLSAFVFTSVFPAAAESNDNLSSSAPQASSPEKQTDSSGGAPFLGIGIGTSYVGLKLFPFSDIGFEGRYSSGIITGDNINIYSGRVYWEFWKPRPVNIFLGAEGGYVQFDALGISGTGYEAGPILGGELFISDRFTFMTDISPTYINLRSLNQTVGDVSWVVNFSIYYYLF